MRFCKSVWLLLLGRRDLHGCSNAFVLFNTHRHGLCFLVLYFRYLSVTSLSLCLPPLFYLGLCQAVEDAVEAVVALECEMVSSKQNPSNLEQDRMLAR